MKIMPIDPKKVKTRKWYRKVLEGCVSSNGKPYSISLKKGSVNRLLVNFVGGGMSWNEETAARPFSVDAILKGKENFYMGSVPNVLMRFIHVGVLSAKDRRNPFRDWFVLNIPYATADLHIGNSEYAYRSVKGENRVLYHHGNKNVKAALNVLKDFFVGTPEVLLIMGESAGGLGCVAHAPDVAELYPGCGNIIVYSEGSNVSSPKWEGVARDIWRVNSELAVYIKSEDLIFDLFRYARDKMPLETQFLHLNSLWDKELTKYTHKMNHGKVAVNEQALHEFHGSLKKAVKKLKNEIPNYFFYLTDYGRSKDGTTPHVFVGSRKLLYGKIQDDTSVAEWLGRAVDRRQTDVGKKFIEG